MFLKITSSIFAQSLSPWVSAPDGFHDDRSSLDPLDFCCHHEQQHPWKYSLVSDRQCQLLAVNPIYVRTITVTVFLYDRANWSGIPALIATLIMCDGELDTTVFHILERPTFFIERPFQSVLKIYWLCKTENIRKLTLRQTKRVRTLWLTLLFANRCEL